MELTPLEIASGVLVGLTPAPSADAAPGVSPLAALEQAILPALLRPPCVVSFSGGMDSSFVLAVAVRLARREGLPLPVPVTWRFPDAPRSHETPWQERVMTGLGLARWEILTAQDGLDLVGPVAQRVLLRFGSVYPANLHLHLPIIDLARGGSLLTGWGGDQILGSAGSPAAGSPVRRARRRVPARAAGLLLWRRDSDALPWLHPQTSRRCLSAQRHEMRTQPGHPDQRMTWYLRRRDLQLAAAHLDRLGSDNDVRVVNPLIAPAFVAALARDVGATAGLTRSDVLRRIGEDHVPAVTTAGRPKATFLEVFLRDPIRELVGSWSGEGVDERFVDPSRLAEAWSRWPIPGGTGALAQAVWLARNRTTPTTPRPEVPA